MDIPRFSFSNALKNKKIICGTFLSGIFLSTPCLQAHEFWIQPHGEAEIGKKISISARIGADWPGEQAINLPNMVESLKLYYGKNEDNGISKGKNNSYVFGHYKVSRDETQTIILTTRNFSLELQAKEFNEYLHEEGLEDTLYYRKKNGSINEDSREIFSRIAKTIAYTGNDNAYQTNFNLPLEITLISQPIARKNKKEFAIKVTSFQKPLQNVQVKAQLQDKKSDLLTTRTDENGIATFNISENGFWRFSTVSIQQIFYNDIQWKSIWSSTTVHID